MRRHVELLDEGAESRFRAVAEGLGRVVVGEEHEDIWFCPRLLFFFGREPGARVCRAEDEEGCPRQHCSNADGSTTTQLLRFCCRGVVTVLSYHLRRDGQRRAIDAAAAGSHQSLSHPCPIACALVANLLGTRSKIIGLDFEDSREGCQTKNCPSGLTLAD